MNDFLKELEEYFKNTPREKVLEDWMKVSEYDESGVLVRDFLSKLENKNIMEQKLQKHRQYLLDEVIPALEIRYNIRILLINAHGSVVRYG